ncbi:hypothetical protein D4Q76_01035 [archaeon]|nr:MAG: hypothetical protein D4Q76_01035 [archaeon]
MKCALYPCFDITCGKVGTREEARWACGGCEGFGCAGKKMKVAEKFLLKTADKKKFRDSNAEEAQAAINILKKSCGLGKGFLALTAEKKKEAFEIEKKTKMSNVGVLSCLMRGVTIAFSHNSGFRAPPLPEVLLAENGRIVGEQANAGKVFYCGAHEDELVLPPIPFPEISGKNACSGSPSPALDAWLRKKMNVKEGDATLLLGFDLE